ncbi:MAG: glucose-6-phosphate dehydrogenase [Kiritimatiellae bacterium]|nr:glucose-6-phosphate dehydrogenase [Kiritimatiellia bacterium]
MNTELDTLSVVVVGASGDLAKRKIFPALFALYCQGFLPAELTITGFARSEMSHEEFRARITEYLTCRYTPGEKDCAEKMEAFLDRCHYVSGQYGSTDAFLDLFMHLQQYEPHSRTNRLFYLAIPPSIFLDVARAIGSAGFVYCGETAPWSRVVIEKPFGHDRDSSDELVHELSLVFSDNQTFRIDHYLGKEVIQNLLVLRFANRIFEPLWNREHIRSVQISWAEQLGVEGRGGYFDQYGIIRDVVQNHLLQILSLVAMEPPDHLASGAIRKEKVRVLKCMETVELDDLVLGQYTASEDGDPPHPGYADDETVPDDSLVCTYAAARLHIDNPRWQGVPFLLRAGKALDRKTTEIRILFRDLDNCVFCGPEGCPHPNELVIRVQPDESISFRITNKVPGLEMDLEARDLDLQYDTAFSELIPDAYEDLLLDVIQGEKSLFIGSQELAAAWDVFTPVLHAIDENRVRPLPYPFGSTGPAEAMDLAVKAGTVWRQ